MTPLTVETAIGWSAGVLSGLNSQLSPSARVRHDRELSVYAGEAGYDFGPTRLRRFTFRTDGFVSVNTPAKGELLTRTLRFSGKSLEINGRTSSSGSIKVEVCNDAGQALPGFEAAQCVPLSGDEIVGEKFGMSAVMGLVRQVSRRDSPVLLLGETGVGEEVVANAIHYSSPRSAGPLIKVNCGAIPEGLIDRSSSVTRRGPSPGPRR